MRLMILIIHQKRKKQKAKKKQTKKKTTNALQHERTSDGNKRPARNRRQSQTNAGDKNRQENGRKMKSKRNEKRREDTRLHFRFLQAGKPPTLAKSSTLMPIFGGPMPSCDSRLKNKRKEKARGPRPDPGPWPGSGYAGGGSGMLDPDMSHRWGSSIHTRGSRSAPGELDPRGGARSAAASGQEECRRIWALHACAEGARRRGHLCIWPGGAPPYAATTAGGAREAPPPLGPCVCAVARLGTRPPASGARATLRRGASGPIPRESLARVSGVLGRERGREIFSREREEERWSD